MILVVEGAVGAGKTYYCTKCIVDHLRRGGIVATNLDLNLPALRKATGRRLSKKQFLAVSADTDPACIPRGDLRGRGSRRVMVVLDEALNWFASSTSRDDSKRAWPEWLRQSDKLGQDVYFVAQAFERSAKWIRELAQICCSVKNLGQIRAAGIPVGKLLRLGKISCCVRYDLTIEQRVGVDFYILTPQIWDCYDTAKLYGFKSSNNAYDDLALWPAHPFPKWSFVFLGLYAGWGILRYALAVI